MSTFGKVVALLALGSLSIAATAATITYDNEATFVSETGGALLTLPNATSANLTIPGELTIDNASAGDFRAGSHIAPWWNLASNYTVKDANENFDLLPDLDKPIYAIGFSLYEPSSTAQMNGCNWTCVDSTFQIQLFSSATLLGSYTIEPPDDDFSFYGFWTADRITKVTIRETVGGVDNEFFGRFMTGTTSNVAVPPPVPLPAAAWLLLSGLGGLGVLGRRRRTA